MQMGLESAVDKTWEKSTAGHCNNHVQIQDSRMGIWTPTALALHPSLCTLSTAHVFTALLVQTQTRWLEGMLAVLFLSLAAISGVQIFPCVCLLSQMQ